MRLKCFEDNVCSHFSMYYYVLYKASSLFKEIVFLSTIAIFVTFKNYISLFTFTANDLYELRINQKE